VKALYVMGENPMMSDPDIAHVEKALKNLDLLIVQDIFLNETAEIAHVVLPTAAWAEKDGTFTNTERRVQMVRKALDAPGEARQDWEIIKELANAMGASWYYPSVKDIMDEINKTTASYAGITFERIKYKGIQWPCLNTDHPGTPILHTHAFTRGKGLFSVCEHKAPAEQTDKEYPFILTTGRILYQYHTATMSRRSKGLVSRTPDAFAEINPADAEKLNVKQGDKLEVSSRRGSIQVVADISQKCDKGVVFIPFHYSEAAVNRLTIPEIDPVANIPEYKVCAVKIRKVA
jgi:predicted molibdopterin-dependent oxidoreductase YjgC